MKVKKSGFTLIELLSVIVILAIVLLIAIPMINNIIFDAKRSSFESSIKNVIRTIEYQIINQENLANGIEIKYYNHEEISNVENLELKYKGKKPKSGVIEVNSKRQISLSLYDGIWCAKKDYEDEKILISSIKENDCFETEIIEQIIEKFNYTGDYQEFIVPKTGLYKIELWGAQGSGQGRGAYTSGEIELKQDEKMYVYIGQGENLEVDGTSFNGGTANSGGISGGGATDIRLTPGTWNNFESLKSRIMVAAGSGSGQGNNATNKGFGGELIGGAGGGTAGGTQTASGNRQSTAYSLSGFGYANGGCSGGNGYYGGGASACASGAGGGSSFISAHSGSNAISESSTSSNIIHTGQPNHYSGYKFEKTLMIAGNKEMPTYDGEDTMIGNQGNGYAKITLLKPGLKPTIELIGQTEITMLVGDVYEELGAKAIDNEDGDISNKVKITSDLTTLIPGKYIITYSVVDTDGNQVSIDRVVNVIDRISKFKYIGDYQEYIVPKTGLYKIELWGAQGSGQGRGAYTSGEIELNKNDKLYVYIGQGENFEWDGTSFNGGRGNSGGQPGGGATDVRLIAGTWNNFESLKSRIMVAAGSGSGSGNNTINKGFGGELVGGAGGGTVGGTQTSAGNRQSTAYSLSGFGYANGGCSGGNGYYGGGAAGCVNGAGGGSSFISGYSGSNAIASNSTSSNIIHTGQPNHYSGHKFINSLMIAGNKEMPTHDGEDTMIGNQGNGYAKITFIE